MDSLAEVYQENTVVSRLTKNWLSRAAVRDKCYIEDPLPQFLPDKNDFPIGLMPFRNHKRFVELSERTQRQVQTLAWLAWNQRVVDTEELVVAPALTILMNGATGITLTGTDRVAIRQTLIDELFHTHMHEVAVNITIKERNIPALIIARLNRASCVYQSYLDLADKIPENWEKDIALLAWCVVGEMSIYEFLRLVSSDVSIQPSSRMLLRLHERDEAAHGSIIDQILRDHYHEFTSQEKAAFSQYLPMAKKGLSQEDWSIWRDILELSGVEKAGQIIMETQQNSNIPNQLPLLRSFQKIDQLCRDLNIE